MSEATPRFDFSEYEEIYKEVSKALAPEVMTMDLKLLRLLIQKSDYEMRKEIIEFYNNTLDLDESTILTITPTTIKLGILEI